MTEPHTPDATDIAFEQLTAAVGGIGFDCTPSELADALLILTLQIAEKADTDRGIAQKLTGMAERYLKRAIATSEAEPSSSTYTAVAVLQNALHALRYIGFDTEQAAGLMRNYASLTAFKIKGSAAAEDLYREADALVGKARPATH